MSDFGEPWKLAPARHGIGVEIYHQDGDPVIKAVGGQVVLLQCEWRRIAAAINACAGIPTEVLEKMSQGDEPVFATLYRLRRQLAAKCGIEADWPIEPLPEYLQTVVDRLTPPQPPESEK